MAKAWDHLANGISTLWQMKKGKYQESEECLGLQKTGRAGQGRDYADQEEDG